jgi:hypothetical protein
MTDYGTPAVVCDDDGDLGVIEFVQAYVLDDADRGARCVRERKQCLVVPVIGVGETDHFGVHVALDAMESRVA